MPVPQLMNSQMPRKNSEHDTVRNDYFLCMVHCSASVQTNPHLQYVFRPISWPQHRVDCGRTNQSLVAHITKTCLAPTKENPSPSLSLLTTTCGTRPSHTRHRHFFNELCSPAANDGTTKALLHTLATTTLGSPRAGRYMCHVWYNSICIHQKLLSLFFRDTFVTSSESQAHVRCPMCSFSLEVWYV